MSITAGQPISASDYINESEIPSPQTGAVGKVVKLESDGKISEEFFNDFSLSKMRTEYTRFYQASDNLKFSNNAENSIDNSVMTKIKEITLNENVSICRLKFDCKQEYSSGGSTDFSDVQFYKNGVGIGSVMTPYRSHTYGDIKTIDVTNLVVGDKIQVYCRCQGSAVDGIYVKDFRIYYDSAITKINGLTLLTPITTLDDFNPALNATSNL